MTIPARHIVGILAQHLLAAVDDILEDFVQGMTDMDVTVGIGRAVMKDEFFPALGIRALAFKQVDLVPMLKQFRLQLRQATAHGKVRSR